ncbi:hypothetical protein ACNKU7_08200 [Microbulbifer sp. SA54]|uniref:hypothetical protein n=1 Tax=Microbulbifer sp. SA54 TaxID=3401577 RepID=UPI003AADBCE5
MYDETSEVAPKEIFSVIHVGAEHNTIDLEISVKNKYKGLGFKSIGVRRKENESYTFAAMLETVEEEGSRKAYLLSVRSSDLKLYDFVVVYSRGDDACSKDETRYQFPLLT